MTTDTYQISEYQPVAAGLADLRHRFGNRAFDLATTAGEREARAARLEMVRLRGSLEAKRKEIKAPALERSRLIDTEARAINDAILALETPIDEQIKAAEAVKEAARLAKIEAEKARVANHQLNIDEIRAAATGHGRASAAQIQLAIDAVLALDVSAAKYEELAGQAESAKNATLADLSKLKADAVAREAETERLRLAGIELDRQRAEQAEAARLAREKLAFEQAEQREVERKAQVARDYADAQAKAERAEAEHKAHAEIAAASLKAKLERDAADLKARDERDEAARLAQADRDALKAELDRRAIALAEQKRLADEADQLRAAEEAKRVAEALAAVAPAPPAPPADLFATCRSVLHLPIAPAPSAGPPTLKLGMMADVLGFDLRAAFLADRLGFNPAATDGNAKLYNLADWPAICDRLIEHVSSVRGMFPAPEGAEKG